jgi:hypothetical protein
MDTFAIGDFATLDGFKVAKSPIAKVSIRLLVLKISYPKRKLFRSTWNGMHIKMTYHMDILTKNLGLQMIRDNKKPRQGEDVS